MTQGRVTPFHSYRRGPPRPLIGLPLPLPLPLPPPGGPPPDWLLATPAGFFFDNFFIASSSTRSVSRLRLSGRMMYLTLFPRTLRWSSEVGFWPFSRIFTVFKCMFMLWSTPFTVPWTTVPFFSSTVTVSWLSFIKNLVSFILSFPQSKPRAKRNRWYDKNI